MQFLQCKGNEKRRPTSGKRKKQHTVGWKENNMGQDLFPVNSTGCFTKSSS